MQAIRKLIADTERWRIAHKAAGRSIEAAACLIRLRALNDALRALEEEADG